MKCDRCPEASAYTRRYSGESLCAGCFSRSIVRKTARTMSKHGMIRDGQTVAVAVSGGKDSLALLKIIHEMSEQHRFDVMAVTIDEGIPGYRDEALGIVRGFCDSLGLDHHVRSYRDSFDMTLDEALVLRGSGKTSSCSICGTFRRRAIDMAAADVGADVIATGHNMDDMIQTFVINMLAGDTSKIGWMDPGGSTGSPRRIKPFCEIYEAEIVFYAFANGIPFQSEQCPHMNEGIRTEIREFLNSLEARHGGIKNSMYQSISRISEAVRGSGGKERVSCIRCGRECTGGTCAVCRTISSLRGDQS